MTSDGAENFEDIKVRVGGWRRAREGWGVHFNSVVGEVLWNEVSGQKPEGNEKLVGSTETAPWRKTLQQLSPAVRTHPQLLAWGPFLLTLHFVSASCGLALLAAFAFFRYFTLAPSCSSVYSKTLEVLAQQMPPQEDSQATYYHGSLSSSLAACVTI